MPQAFSHQRMHSLDGAPSGTTELARCGSIKEQSGIGKHAREIADAGWIQAIDRSSSGCPLL